MWAVWWAPWRRCRAVREPRRPATADRPAEPHGRCELARHRRSTEHALRHPGWGTVRWSTDWTDDGTGLRPLAGEDGPAVTAEAGAEAERLVPWLRLAPEPADPAAVARAAAWAREQAGKAYPVAEPSAVFERRGGQVLAPGARLPLLSDRPPPLPRRPADGWSWTGAAPCCACRYRPCPHHPDESASQATLPTSKGAIADAVRRGQWPLA